MDNVLALVNKVVFKTAMIKTSMLLVKYTVFTLGQCKKPPLQDASGLDLSFCSLNPLVSLPTATILIQIFIAWLDDYYHNLTILPVHMSSTF